MKHYVLFSILHVFCISLLTALSPEAERLGFVDLASVDPSIQISLRYASAENFTGAPVCGYEKPLLLVTKQMAELLKRVQQRVAQDDYSLLIYDAYRPQSAVNSFMTWSKNVADQVKKSFYYPRVDKARVFELGYVAEKSGHSRGSTVDLTLILKNRKVHPVIPISRTLLDGFTFTFLDDGSLDMGSHFDLFDVASHYDNKVIAKEFYERRTYLKRIMEDEGAKPYAEEWWHFTLKDEPYPASLSQSYFDFAIA